MGESARLCLWPQHRFQSLCCCSHPPEDGAYRRALPSAAARRRFLPCVWKVNHALPAAFRWPPSGPREGLVWAVAALPCVIPVSVRANPGRGRPWAVLANSPGREEVKGLDSEECRFLYGFPSPPSPSPTWGLCCWAPPPAWRTARGALGPPSDPRGLLDVIPLMSPTSSRRPRGTGCGGSRWKRLIFLVLAFCVQASHVKEGGVHPEKLSWDLVKKVKNTRP